ncbi:MurT ligase domain-containing protein [Candidatus Saccharibacteria bacterium]|nr:MurT ligase domain-containing protein [Candidatus Saccharibacteria bacterium]MCL1963026.1 MurT ligase domain-containing protein [Candidatus Saccharibacteria bacterium]
MKSVFLASLIGKVVARAARLKGGHASALPGLVAEKINPNFLNKILTKLPYGVVVISGTNGKTTTTKMVTELLRAAGLRVFTNPSGSNFTRGVASSAIREMRRGKLHADIAVVELDEAHAVHFVNKIAPKYSLILNVFRDQLDRFGEIDTTAQFLEKVAARTTGTVILNREDVLVSKIPARHKKYFGYSRNVTKLFPNDDEMYGSADKKTLRPEIPAEIVLEKFSGDVAQFNIGSAKLQLGGAHNALNAAAALALVKVILNSNCHSGLDNCGYTRRQSLYLESNENCNQILKPQHQPKQVLDKQVQDDKVGFDAEKMLATLSEIRPAFGRGENFMISGQPLALNLVKNPSGFRIVLASQHDPNAATMIAINDQYADGCDVSWLYDVNFSTLKSVEIISGIRAYDMALRLECQNIPIGEINTDLHAALAKFLGQNSDRPKQIFTTYTAMLEIRKVLKREAR